MTLLVDEAPPVGCLPRLGIDCLRLAGRALVVGAEGEEDDERGASTLRRGKLDRLAAIQVADPPGKALVN